MTGKAPVIFQGVPGVVRTLCTAFVIVALKSHSGNVEKFKPFKLNGVLLLKRKPFQESIKLY